jgi:lipopolysaccharide heptosyltransferase II
MKILIVKLCCIGDILFTTPAVRALRRGFPKAHLAYLVGSWSKEIIEDNPNLDEIIIYDAPAHSINRRQAVIGTLRCLQYLHRKKFDLAVIFHRSTSSSLFTLLAGIPKRIGFDYAGKSKLLTQKVPFDANKHEVDRYLDITTSLGVEPVGRSTELRVMPQEEEDALRLLREKGVGSEDRIVAILAGGGKNPGTSMPTKRWHPSKFAELADAIIEEYGAKVILIGAPSDQQVAGEVTHAMHNKPIDLVGRTTLKKLSAVLKCCQLFVGGDSGPLHMAAAVDTPTVGIFGPSDPRLVAPRGRIHQVVWSNPPCSPCYRPDTVLTHRDFSTCPEGNMECMQRITVKEVLVAVCQLMEKALG